MNVDEKDTFLRSSKMSEKMMIAGKKSWVVRRLNEKIATVESSSLTAKQKVRSIAAYRANATRQIAKIVVTD